MQDHRAVVAEAAEYVKKNWETDEFCVTLRKIKTGEFKMTVWKASHEYRKEHHRKMQRLRAAYASVGTSASVGECAL